MKNTKKLLFVLLSLVLVLALFACGKCKHADEDDDGICDLCEEAMEIVEAQLDKVSKEISGRISLKNPLSSFLSGVDFTLTEMGVFNGNYRILSATHVVNSNGWQVSADFEK